MTLAKPVYHGFVYELVLHDFRRTYQTDKALGSIHCLHRMPTQAADLLGFKYSGSGRHAFTRRVHFAVQSELHELTVIPFERIQRTQLALEIESITTDRFMSEDWMVFSFATAILEDDLTTFLDIRSTSETDLRRYRLSARSRVAEHLNQVEDHYAQLGSRLDVSIPNEFYDYVPPDEPA